jgi:hypothetical protein
MTQKQSGGGENTNGMSDLVGKIKEVASSSMPEAEKLQRFVNFMAMLKPIDNSEDLILACTYGASSAQRLNRPEMEAQFYITRAKVFIMQTGTLIHEMKNITLAPNWFQFALESEKKRYTELDTRVKKIWGDVQIDIEKAFEAINKNRIAGAVAFVLKTTGEVYGQYYLQLRLYCFKSKSPFYARLANMKIFRWVGVDDFFVLNKTARNKLKIVKRDCLTNLHKAISLFKQSKNYDYLADALLALSTEHRSFQNPIRSRLYLAQAEKLIKKHKITELEGNLALMKKWEPF